MQSYGPRFIFAAKRFSTVFPETNSFHPLRLSRRISVYVLLLLMALAISGGMPGQIATASGTLSFSSSSANFGSVAIGSSHSVSLLITNTGTSAVTLSAAAVSGSWCTVSGVTIPTTIAAGKYIFLTIKFTPTSSGLFSGYITFTSNASNSSMRYTVSGTGVEEGILATTPASVAFGAVVTGVTNSQTVQLKNTGSASLTISSAIVSGAGFKLSGISLPLTLAASQTASLTVSFAPTVSGAASGSVLIKSTALDSVISITLSGTGGTATRTLSLSNSSLSFGSELVGGSTTLGVTVKNTGNSSVTVSGVTVTGTGFSVGSGVSGVTMAAGQSANLNVVFAPKATGSVTGQVTLTSNASNSPNSVATSANGVSSTAHSVALSWSASTTSGVIGYYVYRSTVSGGSYSRITPAPVSATKYADGSVVSGDTYYYVVTSVNATGAESGHSGQAVAEVP
jgi:hypothetical protein